MSGDYARWLANETAAALTHDTPACPVCRDTLIVQCPEPDGSGVYEQACPSPSHSTGDTDRAVRASWPSADELAEMSMHDQEMWERRCAEAEDPATPAPMAGEKETP